MNIKNFLDTLTIEHGETFRGDCPVCNNSKTFTVTNSGSRMLYNCYHADCSISGSQNLRLTKDSFNFLVQNNYKGNKLPEYTLPDYFVTVKRNNRAFDYVRKNHCWSVWLKGISSSFNEHPILYDVKNDRVVFVVSYNNMIVDAVGRRLGKYGAKWHRYNNSRYPYVCGDKQTAVVVEDCASACAVSNKHTGIALLGTHMTKEALTVAKQYDKCIVALDKDASRKSLDIALKLKMHVPVDLVMLEKDIKNMNREDIDKLW